MVEFEVQKVGSRRPQHQEWRFMLSVGHGCVCPHGHPGSRGVVRLEPVQSPAWQHEYVKNRDARDIYLAPF